MTQGIGGSTPEQELAKLKPMNGGISAIGLDEFRARIEKASRLMGEHGMAAVYVNAGTNLYYFTGTRWSPSERMVGALLTAQGEIHYIAPAFEEDTLRGFMQLEGPVHTWEEHESPYALLASMLVEANCASGKLGLDESMPFFLVDGIRKCVGANLELVDAKPVTAGCRVQKSANEIALLQRAKDMTLEVHKRAAKILHEGITTQEVTAFIHQAHRAVGAAGSSFCIVLFGSDSAFPHGVKNPKSLDRDDVVLIDTGCLLEGYNSDITRTYVFGEPTDRHRDIWNLEKEAQLAAFDAAKIGAPCGSVDGAARKVLEAKGLGPGYALPGLPHRTGHGIGLDIHEWPYLVASDETPLAPGMCFSNEPMICIPGEFGIRHEDHFYMTETGPRWFTQPAHTIDDPFG